MGILSRLLRAAISLATIAFIGVFMGSGQARADWLFKFVHVACVPEASYAAVETFGLYNVGVEERAALAENNIYELRDLREKPVDCALPQGRVELKVINYHEPRAQGVCGAVEDADLNISVAGRSLVVARSTHGGCTGFWQHTVRISTYALQHCVSRFDEPFEIVATKDFRPYETQCQTVPLDP